MRIEPLKLTGVNSVSLSNPKPAAGDNKTFGQVLTDILHDVDNLQKDAEKASFRLVTGQVEDLSQVTIATEKAAIALQLTMQVRNKIVDAYQEVMRMQV